MRYQSLTCSEGSNRVTKGPLKSTSDKNLNTSTFTFTLQNCPWQLFPLSTNSLLPVLQLLFLPPKASLLSKFQLAVTSTNGLSFLVSFAFGISSFLRHFTSSHQSLQYWSIKNINTCINVIKRIKSYANSVKHRSSANVSITRTTKTVKLWNRKCA